MPERRLGPDLLDDREETIEDDRHFGSAVLELVLGLARRVERIERHGNGADLDGGQESDDKLRTVRQVDGHPVALLHSEPLQRGGETGDRLVEFGIGERVTEQPPGRGHRQYKRRSLGITAGCRGQQVGQGQRRRLHLVGYALFVVLQPWFVHRHVYGSLGSGTALLSGSRPGKKGRVPVHPGSHFTRN